MTTNQFLAAATDMIQGQYDDMAEKAELPPVQCIWLANVLGNYKGLFIALVGGKPDGHYYEATYRRETSDLWVEVYKKRCTIKISI